MRTSATICIAVMVGGSSIFGACRRACQYTEKRKKGEDLGRKVEEAEERIRRIHPSRARWKSRVGKVESDVSRVHDRDSTSASSSARLPEATGGNRAPPLCMHSQ